VINSDVSHSVVVGLRQDGVELGLNGVVQLQQYESSNAG